MSPIKVQKGGVSVGHPYMRGPVSADKYWLLLLILLCAGFIVGCACYSLRITKQRMRRLAGQDKLSRRGAFEGEGSSHRADCEISCDVSDVSSNESFNQEYAL
ncbi:unnamed protein product [Bursaphelenchus okinawaensis]|uniref:Uncharacterized protein n=1 Tax=Bursaphelenchus okinawaensis TaxID=465554 RepID=A0A811KC53_9BILA|nr:unnamed protein product [Bursaphelenchus okinawaensis]CAG9101418.1 unnamed protein product [Bursaphelenchus okinawaensis]